MAGEGRGSPLSCDSLVPGVLSSCPDVLSILWSLVLGEGCRGLSMVLDAIAELRPVRHQSGVTHSGSTRLLHPWDSPSKNTGAG